MTLAFIVINTLGRDCRDCLLFYHNRLYLSSYTSFTLISSSYNLTNKFLLFRSIHYWTGATALESTRAALKVVSAHILPACQFGSLLPQRTTHQMRHEPAG